MSTLFYVIVAVFIFGVLIAVHELGHFLAARACGVRVLEYAIGMGPAIVSRVSKRGTKISWRCLPVGGYCAMEGEDSDSDDPHAFSNAARWKRLIILVAGAAMNFLLGFVLIFCCFAGQDSFLTPEITGFMTGCPYVGEDGFQEGDVFYRVDGRRVWFSGDVATELARSDSATRDILILRDGEKILLEDYPLVKCDYIDEDTGETVQMYGFYFGVKETGLAAKLKYSWYCALDFVRDVWDGLVSLVTGRVAVSEMSGVVGIVDVIAQTGEASATASDAALNIAYLSALIAVNLAVMNMLPFPALDGGRVFFLLVTWLPEKLLGRPINKKYEAIINTAGLMLLLALMVYLIFNDVARIITR